MPDLGKYAAEVLLAYGVSLALLALVIGVSWWRARRVRRALAKVEGRGE
ncbi:heme exporter protein CcmD [Aestuariibius insulae]